MDRLASPAMNIRAPFVIALAFTLLCTLATGCGDGEVDSGPSYPATATFGHEQGVNMLTSEVFTGQGESPAGTFANSDLFAKANGDALKLYTGGPTSSKNRPVEWFQTGGTADIFDCLSDCDNQVPSEPVPTADGLPLNQAEAGNGFILVVSTGHAFKGHITSASATSVTVEYAPIQ
ncbi:MAG: hypothetical protein QF464_19360 [Myxococcota bacterium]|nr:hypothetical protein [Myxococcota bacterium]